MICLRPGNGATLKDCLLVTILEGLFLAAGVAKWSALGERRGGTVRPAGAGSLNADHSWLWSPVWAGPTIIC